MNIKTWIRKIMTEASVLFTVITAVYALLTWLFNSHEPRVLLDALRILLFFFFSLLLATANTIYRNATFSGGLRLLVHFLISSSAFFFCFLIPLGMQPSGAMVGMLLFVLLYFIIAGIIALFVSRFRKNRDEMETYERQFSKKK